MLKEVLVGLAYMKMLVRMRIESEPSKKRGFLISAKIFHQARSFFLHVLQVKSQSGVTVSRELVSK